MVMHAKQTHKYYGTGQKHFKGTGDDGFVATCIETTARYLNTDYREVFERMVRVGMIDNYILPNYEPLHSESREVLAERLVECLTNWEAEA